MKNRFVALTGLLAFGCSPAAPPPPASPPAPATAPAATPAAPEPPFVYYQMIQAGHVDLVVDEVRLDPEASRCFQARRRLVGGFDFEQGEDALPSDSFTAELEAVAHSFQDWTRQGRTPALVLHGHATADEAQSADAARALSEKRAEAVKARLVAKGLPADRLRAVGHGWTQSLSPLRPVESLKPNRRVEISADLAPPSEAKRVEAQPIASQGLRDLQARIRRLEGKSTPPAISLHAPQMMLVVHDDEGTLELSFDVTSADADAIALHRYFLQGLSNDCTFGAP